MQEQAAMLMERQLRLPDWDLSMLPYWQSLPSYAELLPTMRFSNMQLELLQDEELVRNCAHS